MMYMKILRTLAVLLCALFMLTLPIEASTVAETHDLRLTVYFSAEDVELNGVQFDLFRVAQKNAQGGYTALPAFDEYSFNLNDMTDSALSGLAHMLEGYVQRDAIVPEHTGKTDEEGKVIFPAEGKTLPEGLYLLTAKSFVRGDNLYTIQPVLVALPLQMEEGNPTYDVTIRAKCEVVPDIGGDSLISRKVLKVWKHNGNANKPKEVIVQLLRDGKVYDTVTLNEDNLWRYTWSDLKKGHQWTLVEQSVPGYSGIVQLQGITFVVTNTYGGATPTPTPSQKPGTTPTPTIRPTPSKSPGTSPTTSPGTSSTTTPKPSGTVKPPSSSKPPKLPQTGQNWWPVPMLLSAGLLMLIIGLIRRRMS